MPSDRRHLQKPDNIEPNCSHAWQNPRTACDYRGVVELVRKNGTSVKCYARGDGSYLAANGPGIHFGLERSSDVDRIQAYLLAEACEAWQQTAVDRIANLREGTGQPCH